MSQLSSCSMTESHYNIMRRLHRLFYSFVCKLDRLARSTKHLLEIVENLQEKNAEFYSIGEPWADTTPHAGKMIMTVFAGISEFERDLIRERTGTGRKAAMKRGVRFGRPQKLSPDKQKCEPIHYLPITS